VRVYECRRNPVGYEKYSIDGKLTYAPYFWI
jgi:hypothetical protein